MKSKQLEKKAAKARFLETSINSINEQIKKLIGISKPNELHELRTCELKNILGFAFNISFAEIRHILERRKYKHEKELSEL